MRTWKETEADILTYLSTHLPRPLHEKLMHELTTSQAGKILIECFVSYVRQREVKAAYEKLAAPNTPDFPES